MTAERVGLPDKPVGRVVDHAGHKVGAGGLCLSSPQCVGVRICRSLRYADTNACSKQEEKKKLFTTPCAYPMVETFKGFHR